MIWLVGFLVAAIMSIGAWVCYQWGYRQGRARGEHSMQQAFSDYVPRPVEEHYIDGRRVARSEFEAHLVDDVGGRL